RPRPQPPARATPGSVGRLARPRTQHTRADQHDDDDAEDDPVPDERHEALGGDELHEPRDHGVTGRERDDRGEDGRAPGDVAARGLNLLPGRRRAQWAASPAPGLSTPALTSTMMTTPRTIRYQTNGMKLLVEMNFMNHAITA